MGGCRGLGLNGAMVPLVLCGQYVCSPKQPLYSPGGEGSARHAIGAGRRPCHIVLMAELSIYRVVVRARKKPIGTYTYVITRTDDPNWSESTGESYSTPEAASEAGWLALDRIRATKKADQS